MSRLTRAKFSVVDKLRFNKLPGGRCSRTYQVAMLVSSVLFVSTGTASADELTVTDWPSIQSAITAARHRPVAADGGYAARNPGQQWLTQFDGRSFEVRPDHGDWSWGLQLESYGRTGEVQFADTPKSVHVGGQQVSYYWNDAFTEWYINDARGLEHGFTLHERQGTTDQPIEIMLAVRGRLTPQVSDDRRSVAFVMDDGSAAVNYSDLMVFDADGVELPARFEVVDADERGARIGLRMMLRLIVDDRNARYPLTIDPIAQQAYLKASNTDGGDEFGRAVAVSGNTVVVGAHLESSNATGINGNQSDNSAASTGAAYVFVRGAGGSWTQQAYLKASNAEAGDQFGNAVAISGNTIVVGAVREQSNATGVNGNQSSNAATISGAAYVFVRDTHGIWSQQAYLKASNAEALDQFGCAVAIAGDTVVVGACNERSNATGVNGNQASNGAPFSGAAYVFARSGGVWSQQAYLKASNTNTSDKFGYSVAVSGDTVAIGATGESSIANGINGIQSDNTAASSGAVYVYVRNGGGAWNQQAYVKASNTDFLDQFGSAVALSGDTLAVGASHEGSNATGINGNQLSNSAGGSGAVYAFTRSGGAWSQQAYIKASNTDGGDSFGTALALSGNTLVVGAPQEDSSTAGINGNQSSDATDDSGAAYLFERSGGVWSQTHYLKASNPGVEDFFGVAVAVSGSTVVCGAFGEASNAIGIDGNQSNNSADNAGAAYVFGAVPVIGDMNCDGVFTAADLPAFVQALLDPDAYTAEHAGCDILNGDMQPDGSVDGEDVQLFLNLLNP